MAACGCVWPVAWAPRRPCPAPGGGPAACQASDVLHINFPSASVQRSSNPVSGIDEGGKRMRRTLIPPFQLRLAQRPLSPVRAPRLGGGRRPCPRWPQGCLQPMTPPRRPVALPDRTRREALLLGQSSLCARGEDRVRAQPALTPRGAAPKGHPEPQGRPGWPLRGPETRTDPEWPQLAGNRPSSRL